MKNQKSKNSSDVLGLKVLSSLDERLILGGTANRAEAAHHDIDIAFVHVHHHVNLI